MNSLDNVKINFIIGPGRSGTTLLTTILNQHENSICTPEIRHLIFFKRKYFKISIVTKNLLVDLDKYLEIYFYSKTFPIFTNYNKSLLDNLKIGQPATFQQIVKFVYLLVYKNKSSTINIIIDKNPLYTFYSQEILEIFPDAKFIALNRDYRAYVNSMVQSRKLFIKKKPLSYYAHTWNLFARELIKIQATINEKILIINYEDFVRNKESKIIEIQKFLGLPENLDVLDFYEQSNKAFALENINTEHSERMLKKLSDLSMPVNESRIEAWKINLTPDEIKYVEFFCQKNGNYFGYEAPNTYTFFNRLFYTLKGLPYYIRTQLFKTLKSPRINYWQIRKIHQSKLKMKNGKSK